MKYQANPVVVDAFVIVKVNAEIERGGRESIPVHVIASAELTLEDGRKAVATREMMSRMTPVPGDYWVVQTDGYEYLNPKAVFERKYSPLTMPEPGVKES